MNGLRITSPLPQEVETLVNRTIGTMLAVHRELGAGMPEKAYNRAVAIELGIRKIPFEQEKSIAVKSQGHLVCHQRIDLLIDGRMVVESPWIVFMLCTSPKS